MWTNRRDGGSRRARGFETHSGVPPATARRGDGAGPDTPSGTASLSAGGRSLARCRRAQIGQFCDARLQPDTGALWGVMEALGPDDAAELTTRYTELQNAMATRTRKPLLEIKFGWVPVKVFDVPGRAWTCLGVPGRARTLPGRA